MKSRISDESRAKQGRGKGEGVNWIPWIHGRDFPALTKFNKIPSFKFPGRYMEAFSGIEENLIFLVEAATNIVDFYEQFPLHPLTETIALAKKSGIEHIPFTDKKKAVVTTDLVVKLKNGKLIAICVKSWKALKDPRVIAKIQVEQLYWKKRGVKWIIVTERDFDEVVTYNLKMLREYIFLDNKFRNDLLKLLKVEFKNGNEKVNSVLKKCAKSLKLTYANVIGIFYELVAIRKIRFDHTKLLSIESYASEFSF